MEKREWIFLGAFYSVIIFFTFLLISWVMKNFQLITFIYAFAGALGSFITWSTVGYYFFQKKIRKKKTKFEILEKS